MTMISAPLQSFLVVAEIGNVSRAAERLHLSQPAVTKQLRALEQVLGVRLVERSGRGVSLTRAGALVRDYAARGAGLFDECRLALADLAGEGAGGLSIGAGVTTAIFQLPPLLAELRQQRPGVEISLSTGNSNVIEELVRRREVDCGFVTSKVRGDEIASRVFLREQIVGVVAPDVRRAGQVELESLPLILFPETSGFRAFLDRRLGAERLARLVKMEIDSVEAIKSFVALGLGASLLPLSAVAEELGGRRLRRVQVRGLGRLERSTSMIWRRDRYLSAAGRAFIELASRRK